MKKSKLLLVSASALLAFGMGISLVNTQPSLQEASAATFVDETIEDDFATGIDAEKYDVIDTEEKVGMVEKNGVLKFGGSSYNQGYFRTGSKITRGSGQSVVFQFKAIELCPAGQWFCLQFTDGYAWASNMLMMDLLGNMVFLNGASVPYNMEGTATQWIATNSVTSYRFVWNADGSVDLYGSNDGTNFAKLCYFAAGTFTVPETGYIGFYGNGMTGTCLIDDAKVGLATNAALEGLTWTIEDDFETADNGKFVVDKDVAYNDQVIFEQAGGLKSVMLNDAASGAGIITKAKIEQKEYAAVLLDATLSLDVTTLGTKAVGLGFGLADDATSTDSAHFIGVRAKEGGAELVYLVNGEVADSTDIIYAGGAIKINVLVEAAGEGKYSVEASDQFNTLTINDVENAEGRLSIGLSGEGSTAAKIIGLKANSFKGIIEEGRNLNIDFSSGIDHNWLVNDGLGKVEVDDGLLNFYAGTGDGTRLQTRQRYVNFDLQFDAKLQQYDEDDDGNVTPASTWLGVSFGRESYDANYWDGDMIYFTADTVNSIQARSGVTPSGVPTARGWFTPEYLLLDAANKDVMFHFHIVAFNGTVSVGMQRDDLVETTIIIYEDMKTDGYISFAGTSGANYYIDSVKLANLDGTGLGNVAPVASDYQETVEAGETFTGVVSATDKDEYDAEYLTYEIVEDNTAELGALSFENDGTYTFAAKEGVEGEVTFTYKAFDTEDYSEVKTVTITVTAKEEPPVDTSESEPVDTSESEPGETSESEPVTPSDSSSEQQPAKKGGCGGSILATSALLSILAVAGIGIVASKKKEDK